MWEIFKNEFTPDDSGPFWITPRKDCKPHVKTIEVLWKKRYVMSLRDRKETNMDVTSPIEKRIYQHRKWVKEGLSELLDQRIQ